MSQFGFGKLNLLIQSVFDLFHDSFDFAAVFWNDLAGVNDSGMVSATEELTDMFQRRPGEFPREIHRYLSGECDIFRPSLPADLFGGYSDIFRYDIQNILESNSFPHCECRAIVLTDDIKCQFLGDVFSLNRCIGEKTNQSAFEFADIRCYALSDERYNFIGEFDTIC